MWAHIVIFEKLSPNLGPYFDFRKPSPPPRLVSTPGRTSVFTGGRFPASIVISENLPRRQGLPPTPRRARVLTRGLEAEAGEPGAGSWEPGAGSREAGEIRMLVHWATGVRSGLLPEDWGVAAPEMCQKTCDLGGGLRDGFDLWRQGMNF